MSPDLWFPFLFVTINKIKLLCFITGSCELSVRGYMRFLFRNVIHTLFVRVQRLSLVWCAAVTSLVEVLQLTTSSTSATNLCLTSVATSKDTTQWVFLFVFSSASDSHILMCSWFQITVFLLFFILVFFNPCTLMPGGYSLFCFEALIGWSLI